MKVADLRTKNSQELQDTLLDLLKQQLNLRVINATGELAQNHQFKQIRRDIARIKTVMHQAKD